MAMFCEQGDQSLDSTKVGNFCRKIGCTVEIIVDVNLVIRVNKAILME
jgi:hypothetical protein